jgi:hypothetical protein
MTHAPPITPGEVGTTAALTDAARVERVFALVDSRGGNVEELAEAAGITVQAAQSVLADPASVARLLAAQRSAEDSGELLKPVAARLTLEMLHKVGADLASGALDIDDIGNLLPKVHKVVEHADRMEAARGDGYDGLPVFHITFMNGTLRAEVVADADVVDNAVSEASE